VFNEYSFVPRSAILNGLGSLRILPYCLSAGGTRPIKERWRGGQERGERERERERGRERRKETIDIAVYGDRSDRKLGKPVLRALLKFYFASFLRQYFSTLV